MHLVGPAIGALVAVAEMRQIEGDRVVPGPPEGERDPGSVLIAADEDAVAWGRAGQPTRV